MQEGGIVLFRHEGKCLLIDGTVSFLHLREDLLQIFKEGDQLRTGEGGFLSLQKGAEPALDLTSCPQIDGIKILSGQPVRKKGTNSIFCISAILLTEKYLLFQRI